MNQIDEDGDSYKYHMLSKLSKEAGISLDEIKKLEKRLSKLEKRMELVLRELYPEGPPNPLD